jgi:hypothetical protein
LGESQNELLETIKTHLEEAETKAEEQSASGVGELTGESGEKQKAILSTFPDEKYKDFREFLVQHVAVESGFATVQKYLDNILASSARVAVNDLNSFSEGLKKIKELRDTLEKELSS